MMWEAAARKISQRGGRIVMGRELVALDYRCGPTISGASRSRRDGGRELHGAPCHHLGADARTDAERSADAHLAAARARAALSRLPHRRADGRQARLFPDNWIYIHDPSVKVGRVQNFSSWSPEMVPDGMSCLGLEYFCFEGDGLWNDARQRPDRARQTEIGRSRTGHSRRRHRRLRGAPAQGLSGLRRRLREHMSRRSGSISRATIRACIWSAATACTSTTTRTMR